MNWSTLQRGLDLHVSAVASPEPRTDSEARFSGTHRGCWSRGKICGLRPSWEEAQEESGNETNSKD